MPTFRMRDGTGSFRLRYVVEDTDRVRAGRIVSKAERDVQIDGEKIHLG